ncbi:MAG TPA: hypothetical protein VN914_10185, partial [Polyangia bacterium]|nr:hypothetical protein [Polyangia bacterium]
MIAAVLLSACSNQDSAEGYPPPGRQHLRGFFVAYSELSAFQLCGRGELTWVERQGWEPGLEKLSIGAVP